MRHLADRSLPSGSLPIRGAFAKQREILKVAVAFAINRYAA
jgi:hypothetical protein